MKPENAREKWCPFAMIYSGENASFNRTGEGSMLLESFCIADICMMWRWVKNKDDAFGYCGLAGVID